MNMNLINRTTKLLALFAIAAVLSFGQQYTLSTTTLSSSIATNTVTTINLSTTGMLSSGPANQINTLLYVDHESMPVVTVIDTTHALVRRGQNGTRPFVHASGATVWFNPSGSPTAGVFLGNSPIEAEGVGSCLAANELFLPRIYIKSGHKWDCMGGQWVLTSDPSYPVLGAVVASPAGVMTATGTIFHVSGTNAVTGLTVPKGWAPGMCLTIIPDAAFTTTTATNISIASTGVIGKALFECWDGTKWNPSY